MDRAERTRLVAPYESGYDVVIEALAGITERELEIAEAPGEWTPRQVAHHLGDSEMTAAIRVRRMIAEDDPLIVAYDQDEFARRLHYDRPIEASLAAFKATRDSTSALLRSLSEAEWARRHPFRSREVRGDRMVAIDGSSRAGSRRPDSARAGGRGPLVSAFS